MYKRNLILKVNYISDDQEIHTLEILFQILKKDEPLELAKYIQEKVLDEKRKGKYNIWASTTIKSHNRCVRRLYKSYNVQIINKSRRVIINRRNKISRNYRNLRHKRREKFGVIIPNFTRDALLLDKLNGNNNWAEAITKEMTALEKLNCFHYHSPGTKFEKDKG